MSQIPPEWYLTSEEQARLSQIEGEARYLKSRHDDITAKMRHMAGKSSKLSDAEIIELRDVNQKYRALYEERQVLLAKNPMLPENVLKAMDER